MRKKNTKLLIFITLMLVIPFSMVMDQFTPSMPYMVDALKTTPSLVQLTIPVYLLSGSISALVWGTLSDRYGRRIILLISYPIGILGCIICVSAPGIGILLIGRLLQGIGLSSSCLLAYAVMADVFKGKELNKVSSYLSVTYCLVPILAPMTGGFLQSLFSWRANFIFLLIVCSGFYLIFMIFMPETHTPTEQHNLDIKRITKNYLIVLKDNCFLLAVLCMISAWSIEIAFSLKGPFLFHNSFGINAAEYGLIALIVGLGTMIGSFMNIFLIKYVSPEKLGKNCLLGALIISLILVSSIYMNFSYMWLVILVSFSVVFVSGIIYPNFVAVAVSAHPSLAGTANALIIGIVTLGATVSTTVISFFHGSSLKILSITFIVLIILCLLFHLLTCRMQKKRIDKV